MILGNKYIMIMFFLLKISFILNAQLSMNPDSYKNQPKGIKIKEKKYFNRFALLLQDTISDFNGQSNSIYYGDYSQTRSIYYDDINCKKVSMRFLIVDKDLFLKIEEFMSKQNDFNCLRKYIRLYMGYVSCKGDTCVTVQYLRYLEYLKRKRYYSRDLDLFVYHRPKFHYLLIKNNNIFIVDRMSPLCH